MSQPTELQGHGLRSIARPQLAIWMQTINGPIDTVCGGHNAYKDGFQHQENECVRHGSVVSCSLNM